MDHYLPTIHFVAIILNPSSILGVRVV